MARYKRFNHVFESSPDPTLITNTKGEICYVNPAWEKHTGYTFKEVYRKNPRFLGSGKTPMSLYKDLWAAVTNNRSFTTEAVIDKKKDGTEYQIRSTFYPIVLKNKPAFFVQIMHDITRRKEIEKMRQTFLSTAAHELKTPITTLKLMTQVLNKQHCTPDDKNQEFTVLNHELDRLTNLIDQMLDLSRIESDKIVILSQDFNINELILNVIKKLQLLSKDHKIIFNSKNKYDVHADLYRIEQVLTNLITNAIKYSSQGTKISVKIRKSASKVIILVEDKGQGIPKEKRPHVFEKFYQVSKNSKTGFGLGLYICDQILKEHKEKIWVTSQMGAGTTFSFSLPIVDKGSNNK